MRNNYALQTSQAAALFLTYDPDNMVRLHGLERADDRIEVLFMDFAIFNVADICVCCGAFLAAAAMIFSDMKQKKTTEGA